MELHAFALLFGCACMRCIACEFYYKFIINNVRRRKDGGDATAGGRQTHSAIDAPL